MIILYFNCYCPGKYHGYLNNGGQLPPPLNNFRQFTALPSELQLEIIKHAMGDTASGLAQLELVSSEWRYYVLNDLWPLFLKKQFPVEKIAEAKEIIQSFGKEATVKNIYKFLLAPSASVTLSPSQEIATTEIIPKKPFFWFVKNTGQKSIRNWVHDGFSTLGVRPVRSVLPGQSYLSYKLFPPTGKTFYLNIACGTEPYLPYPVTGCQGTGEIREFNL